MKEEIQELCEDIAVVKEAKEGDILVELEKKGACRSCGINMLCMGGAKAKQFKVKTKLHLKAGDRVKLSITPGARLLSSFVVFIFPVLMMLIFYYITRYFVGLSEDYAIFSSIIGLLLSGFVIFIADKKLSNRLKVEVIEKVS